MARGFSIFVSCVSGSDKQSVVFERTSMLASVFPRDDVGFLYFAHKHGHHTLPIEEAPAEAH